MIEVPMLASIWSLCLASASVGPAGYRSWSLAPIVLIPLSAFGALYALGMLRREGERPVAKMRGETVAAAAALLFLVIALVSPLCRLSSALAFAHMIQHVILVALAPPLLVLAAPLRTLGAVLRGRSAPGSPASFLDLQWNRPLLAAGTYGFAIWFWHLPAAYELALTSAVLHVVYLGSLLATSTWFWACVVRAASPGAVALSLFVTIVHTGLLGALLTFAPWPLYPLMSGGALAFGLSPIEDQQLAGLIMWVPMGVVYLVSALVVIGRGLLVEPAAQPDQP